MSAKIIHYSVCRYVPDILRDEFINVGVLVHIPDEKSCHFYKTKNLARIRNFDDEVELDVISALLESLEYQFNTSTIHVPDLYGIEEHDFLKKETSYFVNQLQFSDIRTLTSENPHEDVKDLCDMYLYYDKKKSERITKERVRRLVSKMFMNSMLKSRVERNPSPMNNFQQKPFDFVIKLNDRETLIKTLSFDYKQSNKLFNEIKSFLYDIQYFKDHDITDIKVVINNTQFDREFEQLAIEQLKKYIDVYTIEEFSLYIDKMELELLK